MLEQLRIKCPSCGIILDVKNSKHEAVKRIVCPNCQKQLAIDFQEKEKPAALPKPLGALYYGEMRIALQEGVNEVPLADCKHVEIKVVRLNDGNSKCMVRPIDEEHDVFLNREKMQADDQVTLAKGDQLQIGNIALVYDKPGAMTDMPKPPVPQKPQPLQDRSFSWLYAALACAVLAIAVILLWPSIKQETPKAKPKLITADTILKKSEPQDSPRVRIEKKEKTMKSGKEVKEVTESKNDKSQMNDYSLEQLASKGDTDAQYELGVKLIKRGGINNVVRGVNYLKLASNSGSSKARTALAKAIQSLQKQANQGDSISYYILKSI